MPDVMYMWNYPAYYKGLESMDEWIEKEGGDEFKSQFSDTLWELQLIRWNYIWHSVGFATHALFYNKDLFAEVGLEAPTGEWTWDDLQKAAKTISEKQMPKRICIPDETRSI